MLGAIIGDVIGSVFEASPIKTTDFELFSPNSRFTDDTVMTIAIAYAVLHGLDYGEALRRFGRRYPDAGYGGSFYHWLMMENSAPYGSWGNGAAMRVSPIGFAFDTSERVLDEEARRTAIVSHNHPEGVKGAQATALAVFLARQGITKLAIREEITRRFGYDLVRNLAQIRLEYRFDVSSQGSVPESIIAFLESVDFRDAVCQSISLGGDSDTMACISGAIAEAYYKEVPTELESQVRKRLPAEFLTVLDEFRRRYGLCPSSDP